jgi:hypothetical protein
MKQSLDFIERDCFPGLRQGRRFARNDTVKMTLHEYSTDRVALTGVGHARLRQIFIPAQFAVQKRYEH